MAETQPAPGTETPRQATNNLSAIKAIYEKAADAEARESGPIATHSAAARAVYEACLRDLARLNAPNPRALSLGRAHPGVALLAAYWSHFTSSTGLPPSWPDLMLLTSDELQSRRVAQLKGAGVAVSAPGPDPERVAAHIARSLEMAADVQSMLDSGYQGLTREALATLLDAIRMVGVALKGKPGCVIRA